MKMMNRSYFIKLFQNPKVKLYSFLAALLLWFYIVTENSYNHTLNVDLRLINQPSGWILTRAIPDKIKIQFQGSGRDLMALGSKKLHIDLNLEETIKDITFPISIENIQGMSEGTSVEPLRVIEPTSVRIHLDQYHEKIVPIHSNIIFEFMDGYTQVGVVALEPDSVKICGPGAFVDAVNEVYTDSVTYKNILKEITGKVDINPPEIETISYSLKKVRFRCDVQRIGERFIADIPVRVTNVPRNQKVTVAPSTFSLKLQGGVKILSKLQKEDIIATIDFQHQRYRGKKIPATIQVPPGITFTESKPSSFEIFIEQ